MVLLFLNLLYIRHGIDKHATISSLHFHVSIGHYFDDHAAYGATILQIDNVLHALS